MRVHIIHSSFATAGCKGAAEGRHASSAALAVCPIEPKLSRLSHELRQKMPKNLFGRSCLEPKGMPWIDAWLDR